MKKSVWIFGLIMGTLLCVNLLYVMRLFYSGEDFESNDFAGYTVQVVIFSLIFFGVRNYRNKDLGGAISFGKAFKAGALVAVVGCTLYVVVWLFYYYMFAPDFLDRYIPHALKETSRSGGDVETMQAQLESLREMYRNPLMIVVITYLEVLPVALIVALASALLLRKKPAGESHGQSAAR